jgi:hypothetical protein
MTPTSPAKITIPPLEVIKADLTAGLVCWWYNFNMNYELAKELKDAGFPVVTYEDTFNYPTLEELIEACTKNMPHFRLVLKAQTWVADFDDDFKREGTSPTEAVARLWLTLNRKV